MDTRLKCKKSPMIIPSSCSCPSCDSLECFSRRYNSGLQKCTCSKCNLTNCRYMPKTEPADQISDHKVRVHDSMDSNTDNHCCNTSKVQSTNSMNVHKTSDYNINDDDVSRIDVVVTKDTSYGEIKERVFRDHKERIVIKKSSTTTQTNTKFKKFSSSILYPNAICEDNKYTKNVPTSTPNIDSYQNKDAECNTCPKSCSAKSFGAPLGQKPLPFTISIKVSPINIKNKESREQEKHIKEFPSMTTYNVLRDGKTNTQTKESIATFKGDRGNNKVNNIISSCNICEEPLDVKDVPRKSSKRNQEEVNDSKKISLSTTGHLIQEQNGQPYFSLREQNKEIKALPSKGYKIVLEEKTYTKSVSPSVTSQSILEKNKDSNEFSGEQNKNNMKSPSLALCGTVKEQIIGTKSLPTKPYQVIRLDNKYTYDLPVRTSYETVKEPKADTNNSSVRGQIKENKESPFNITCKAVLDPIKDIQSNPNKFYKFAKDNDDKKIPICIGCKSVCTTCEPAKDQIKDTDDFLVSDITKEFKRGTICDVSEQIKNINDFPVKSQKVVEVKDKDLKKISPCTKCESIEESTLCEPIGDQNEDTGNSSVSDQITKARESESGTTRDFHLEQIKLKKYHDFSIKKETRNTKASAACTCARVLEQIKDTNGFPTKSYKVVTGEDKNTNEVSPSEVGSVGDQSKNTSNSSVNKKIKKTLEFQSCITCGAVLEQIKDSKNFPTKSYKVVPVSSSNKNVQEILTSTTFNLIEEPKDTLVREQMKKTGEPCLICGVVLDEIKNTRDISTNPYKMNEVENKEFATCVIWESDNIQKKDSLGEQIKITKDSTSCTTCGTYLEHIKETKDFQTKSYKVVSGENKGARDLSHCAIYDLVGTEKKNINEDTQEHLASATYKSLGRPNETTKDFESKQSCTTCGAVIEHIKDTRDSSTKSYKLIKVEDEDTLDFTPCALCESDKVQNKENVVEQIKITKDSTNFTTCGKVLEEIKETKDLQIKSYKVLRGGNKDAKDPSHCARCNSAGKEKKNYQQLLSCPTHKSVEEPKEGIKDILVRNQMDKNSAFCKCEVVLDVIKDSRAFPAKSYKVIKVEDSDTSDFALCAICDSNDVEKKENKNTRECGTILQQLRDTEECKNKSNTDLPHSAICDSVGKEKTENNNFSVGEYIENMKKFPSSADCNALLEQIKDTKGFPKKTFKVVINDDEESKVPSSNETTKGVVVKANTSGTNDPPSSTSCNIVLKQKVMFCTKEIPPNTTCRTVIEHTVTSGVKDSTANNMDTKILTHNIQEQMKDINKLAVGTTQNTVKEQPKDSTMIPSGEKFNTFRSSAASETKCKIFRENMKKQNINFNKAPKLLTKHDIYNRILEAYNNCNCQVCECIVTLNDASTLKSSESCECKPCECLKSTASTKSFTTKHQSDVRLLALTDSSEDFCNCKPCGCLVCTRQSEKECNCNPCECLQCLGISYKKEEFPAEPKDCDCSFCQCEECKKNAGLASVLVTHEMSAGPDGIQQPCTCALCSYHFCGHELSDLENEPCECENQNKFMRKPNAGCVQDYNILTVSVDVANIKPNLSHSRDYLDSMDAPITGSSLLDDTKVTKRVCKLKFQTCKKAAKCTQNYNLLETHSAANDSEPDSENSRKVESSISLYTGDSYSGQYKNITEQNKDISLEDKTRLDLEVEKKLRTKRKVNVPQKQICNDYATECTTRSSESVVTENGSGTCENLSASISKERHKSTSHKHSISKSQTKNFQIYNIKQYTLKNNSSKLTTSSRNISTGSSKLVQTIIYEICHEILECIVVEVTKDVAIKIELVGKPKSITVLKDAKTKSDEVDFSESSLQLKPTDNNSVEDTTKTEEISSTYQNQHDFANEDALQVSDSKINSNLFNTSSTKKQNKGGYQDCNFCIVDKSFGNILNCNKYTKNGISSEHLRYPNVLHASKISRPDFPLKYSWINTSELDNDSQISIHGSNNYEYYNNMFELQVYNIRLENTLKKAKTFSMELMKILHKFEKANKNFKSLSKKFHPIPSEFQENRHEDESISGTEEYNKTILPQEKLKRCTSPLKKIKTCFKCKNTNKESRFENENTDSLKIHREIDVDQGQSTYENSYSECILYNESLDKGLSSPYTMKHRDSKPKINTNTGPDPKRGSFTVGLKDGIKLRADKMSGAFKETNDQDGMEDYRPYNLLQSPQQQMHVRKWSSQRKNFDLNDARPPTKSIGVSVRPISIVGAPHDDMKSAVVQTHQWDGNTFKKTTYENRALAKLKMEVTQLSNMPFLQPHIWSNSYDEGTSDSKSDLDDFSSLPPKQKVIYKENMWDTLFQDIDYSYTLPPKRTIDENRNFGVNLDITENEYQSPPKLEGHAFIHPRKHSESLQPTLILDDQETHSYNNSNFMEDGRSRFSTASNKPEESVRHLTQSKKIEDTGIPYSPKDDVSDQEKQIDNAEYLEPRVIDALKEPVSKDLKRYKDFLKELQLKGPKNPTHEKKALDCKNSSCIGLKVGLVAVRRVSNHTAIVKWTPPKVAKCILGYEILIDGRSVQKILNPTCRMCVVTCLPYTEAVLVTIRTLTSRATDHAPASTVVYRPRLK